ncbi:histidine-phosphotransfer domain, HPT domain-containing protein [Coniochaeta ligniaria NRRL 30616]|uniref:Histidine-phosphotransfer domain, HPT domain-containing protein n=1 Tax=Coniochaeta ligniaria NRRL 30616 TaxID=1408157 RepID=A0A1J7IJ79_9PEZI|nr:histidine-phosphotransfer domain, HPT domain-containing protein [Coniochaeta ligniaria NRRL 30616]
MPDFGDNVDVATFAQILEMDDDEADRDFSKPLVFNFFEQAEETFGKMDTALANKDLAELSSLGHFLKGSSATLGFIRVKDSCQVIQQFGHKLNLDGSPEPDEQVCLAKITEALQSAKEDMAKLETLLRKFFGEGSD